MSKITTAVSACMIASIACSVFAETILENHISSSANTGGNTVSPGGIVVTGEASASVSVHTEINSSAGTTTVQVTATANEKTETVVEEVSGADVFVEVEASADSGAREDENASTITISRALPPLEMYWAAPRILETILSVLKSSFVYVISIFL